MEEGPGSGPTAALRGRRLGLSAPRRVALRRSVLGPGDAALRRLPWRDSRDPWAVLVSELMLQQTRAARVVEPYGAFLASFPDPAACAAASVGEVLRAWSGLGYNRRAANLHAAAVVMVERHGGAVPDRLDDLLALPGVGPYTARAVLAFAFERHVAVVDVNVGRVLARAVAGAPLSPSSAQELADDLVPHGRSWSWNQALLEHGATCCTARAPRCDGCRLARCCVWWRCGCPRPDPGRSTVRQGVFEGSDRQGRGRLVATLVDGPVPESDLAAACGWPEDPDRARRVAERLMAEGLVRCDPRGVLRLP